jgi:hypothetical protein
MNHKRILLNPKQSLNLEDSLQPLKIIKVKNPKKKKLLVPQKKSQNKKDP